MNPKTAVWAHRGASGWDTQYAPENTMPAFEKAVAMGADGIETDVQMTADGVIVVCHDEKIDRTSDGTGYLKQMTYRELQSFSFHGAHPEYGRVPLPTLEDLLALLKPTRLTLNIELKTGVIYYDGLEEQTLELVRKHGMEDRVIYSSFNYYSLQKLKQIDASARIGLLYGDGYLVPERDAALLHAEALHPPLALATDAYVRRCHDAGQKIHVWTVDVKTEMKRLCLAGADAIITDCPDVGRRIADGDYSVIPG